MWAGERKAFDRMGKKNNSFYNSAPWRKLAKAYKAQHPLCVNHATCRGVVHTVDHITPINEGGAMYDMDNLQGLCVKCNAKKTGRQARRTADKPTQGGV